MIKHFLTILADIPPTESPILSNDTTITDLILIIVKYGIYVAGLIALAFLVIGGYQYITAGGNEESSKKAVKTITSAVLGLILVFAAYGVIYSIMNYALGYTWSL